jgi:hypothetical protein
LVGSSHHHDAMAVRYRLGDLSPRRRRHWRPATAEGRRRHPCHFPLALLCPLRPFGGLVGIAAASSSTSCSTESEEPVLHCPERDGRTEGNGTTTRCQASPARPQYRARDGLASLPGSLCYLAGITSTEGRRLLRIATRRQSMLPRFASRLRAVSHVSS